MEEALRLIIAKSPAAMHEAIDCLRAIRAKSPVVNLRYERALELALGDPEAEFTAPERAILAQAIEPDDDDTRSYMLRIRLTEMERAGLVERATAAGQTMSEYMRRLLAE